MSAIRWQSSKNVHSRLEGEKEQATNSEEGSRCHAGVDGGSGTIRNIAIARCLTRGRRRGGRSTVKGLGESDERCEVVLRGGVDGKDHTLAAVVALPAVQPDWLLIVDSDVEGREINCAICDGREARIEALHIRGKLELAARSTERGLRNGVVLCSEFENLLAYTSTQGYFLKDWV